MKLPALLAITHVTLFVLGACGSPDEDSNGDSGATGGDGFAPATGGSDAVGGGSSGGSPSTGGDGAGSEFVDCLPTETSCLRAQAVTDTGTSSQICLNTELARSPDSVVITCAVPDEELDVRVQLVIPENDGPFSAVVGEDTGFHFGMTRQTPYLWVRDSNGDFEMGTIEGTRTMVDGGILLKGSFTGSWSSGGNNCDAECGPVVLEGRLQVELSP